ncbi:MAG: hypothetical protein IPM49_11055 [Flavobacteriales bacterium]|nr:hypothetical protein [Flavobacteriales bacterium]
MHKGWSLGARVDVTQPYFGAEGQVDDPAHGNPPGSNTARLTGLKRLNAAIIYMECMATAGLPVIVGRRWRLDAAFELGVNPGVSSSTGTSIGHTALTDTGRIYVFSAALGVRGADWWPMFGLELKSSYRLANHDRLTVALEGRLSGTTYWEGAYSIYAGGPSPSTGTFSGHLAYIGFRMGYAFTWGPPRKPRWMRRQEAAGRPVPTP